MVTVLGATSSSSGCKANKPPDDVVPPASEATTFHCTRLNLSEPGFQATVCEESAAACAKSAARWKAEVSAEPSACESVTQMFCYESRVEDEPPIRSCHQTQPDCAATRSHEEEHNDLGPVLTACVEKR